MSRARGAAQELLAAAALIVLLLAGGARAAAAPAPQQAHWFALDLPAEGEPPLVPLADAELAALLAGHGFTGVLLDRPRGDPRDAATLGAPWRAAGLDVRIADRATVRIAELPAWPAVELRPLPSRDGAATESWLAPCTRPAVVAHLWQRAPNRTADEDASGLAAPATARYLSCRLLLPTAPALRRAQLQLDLASFGARAPAAAPSPLPSDARLTRQSALASELAALLGGDHPELVAPLENLASATTDALRHRPLRRAPEWLEADEWLLSFGADATLLAARLLRVRAPPAGLAGALAAARAVGGEADARASEPPPAGVAGDATLAWLADALEQRWQAAGRLATRLREPQFEAGERLSASAPPPEFALPSWSAGATFEADAALDARAALHPWRVRRLALELTSPQLRPPGRPVALLATTLDDPRLAPFAAELQPALDGRPFDLSRWLPIAPGTRATLRATLALRDPRPYRLLLAAEAWRTVRLNGAVVVEPFAAERGALRTTVLLPAGTSELEFELAFTGADGRVTVALELLPPRSGGLTLPAAAAALREPLVRIGDSSALDGTSLRLLATAARAGGEASFPFALDGEGLHDLWIHRLAGSEATTLEVACDDGPPQSVAIAAGGGWRWQRVDLPFELRTGGHALRLRLRDPSLRLDAIGIVPSDTVFPRPPSGAAPLWESAWRFDPLGAGLVVDLPPLAVGELFGRAFTAEKSGSYRLHAWLDGRDPLAPGQHAEVELSSASTRLRMILPAGAPSEEWIELGEVSLTAGERVELRVRGDGALARVALLR
ncbi:MAG: hypothetical protein JNL90_07495 [Planctomycetes bacterium]|nr:hypothetical protein [Planctomycetota bacterium]